MIKTSTKNDIVKWIYGDPSDAAIRKTPSDHLGLSDEIIDEVQAFRKVQRALSKFQLSAPDGSVKRIMEASRKEAAESA